MNAIHPAQHDRASRAPNHSRRGNALLLAIVAIVIVGVLALVGWWMFGRSTGQEGPQLLVNTVTSGPYDYVVLEQGEVQSASNIEMRCEVRSRGGGGTGGSITIIEVIPEGTIVQAGDVVIRLDSSALEQEQVSQQIKVNGQQSLVAQATNLLKSAKISRTEYLEGTFKQEEMLINSEVFVAEGGLRSAQLSFDSAQRLAAKGLLGGLQLEGADKAVQSARNTLDIAKSKLGVLRQYTKDKMLTTFDSDIKSAEAKLSAEESSLKLEQTKLADIEDQIGKCTMRAPVAGQVVYANEYSNRSGTAEFVVVAGATVREQQLIVRLPSSNEMQIKALINEARVTLVRPGLPVSVRVDALKDELIQGEVTKVNQYAEPGGGWSSGNIKKYAAFVKILNPPPSLRSGMNAEVRIHVERRSEALLVAVQGLAEHKGHYFCLVQNGGKYETREVKIGSTNNKVAVIESGLVAGDTVVLNPRGHTSLLNLPDLPDPTPLKMNDIARTKPDEAPVRPASVGRGGGNPEAGEGRGGGAGGEGGSGKGKGKGRGNFTPAMIVNRAFEESDADKDGKFSKEEIASMESRRQQMVATADTNADGFVDRAEMTVAAAAFSQQMRARTGDGNGGSPATGGGE